MMYKPKDEQKEQMLEEIGTFLKEEYDLDLGIIGRENVYDFFMDTMGKYIYNDALDDAKKFYDRQLENVSSDFYALYKD